MPSGKMFTRMGMIVVVAALGSACPGEEAPPPTAEPVTFDTLPPAVTPADTPGVAPAPTPADTPAAAAPAPGQPPAQQPAAPAAPATPPAQAGNVQAGQQLYAGPGLCFTCHGQGGVGTPLGPNLTDGQWIWFTGPPSLDEMVTLIRTGVTTPRQYPAPMPAMGGANLNETQLRDVAAYVLSLSR